MIYLFGQPTITAGEKTTGQLPKKAYLIIALLTDTSGDLIRRSALASWLWENSTTKQAFANLRQLLAKIRRFEQKYGTHILKSNQDFVCLNADVHIDLRDFLNTDILTTPQQVTQFVAMFVPRLLSELSGEFDEELSTWLANFQKRCDDQFLRIALCGVANIDENSAIACLESILTYYPHHEPTCIALLQRYASQKNWQKVRSVFNHFSQFLKSNLDADPSESLQTIYARLLPEDILTLEDKFGYLTSSQAASLPFTDSLPRLLVIPNQYKNLDVSPLTKSFLTDITHSLCQMRCFTVISPSSTQFVVPNGQPLSTLAADFALTVSETLHGTVLLLTCLHTSNVLFSQTLPFSLPDTSGTIYVLIAQSVRSAVNEAILKNAEDHCVWPAYCLYLEAESALTFGDLPSIRSARKKIREALQNSPSFYLAKQTLARTYFLEWLMLGRKEQNCLLEAKKIAIELVKSDPMIAGGYWQLSTALLYLGNFESALDHIDAAIKLSPFNANITAHKADVLCHIGRTEEAMEFITKAFSLTSLAPDEFYWIRAGIHFLMQDYELALSDMHRCELLTPFNCRMFAACHAMLGNISEATRSRSAHLDEYPDFLVSDWEDALLLKNNSDMQHYAIALRRAGFH